MQFCPKKKSEANRPNPVESDLMSRKELDSKLATLPQAIALINTRKQPVNNGVNNRGKTHTTARTVVRIKLIDVKLIC